MIPQCIRRKRGADSSVRRKDVGDVGNQPSCNLATRIRNTSSKGVDWLRTCMAHVAQLKGRTRRRSFQSCLYLSRSAKNIFTMSSPVDWTWACRERGQAAERPSHVAIVLRRRFTLLRDSWIHREHQRRGVFRATCLHEEQT